MIGLTRKIAVKVPLNFTKYHWLNISLRHGELAFRKMNIFTTSNTYSARNVKKFKSSTTQQTSMSSSHISIIVHTLNT